MNIKIFIISIIIVHILVGCSNEVKPSCNKSIGNDKGICTILADPSKESTPTKINKRVALVIGNANYKFAPLKNPVNDAEDMTKALMKLKFDVTFKKNINSKSIRYEINKFKTKLGKDVIGLFYFSGHGIQEADINYMIPIDISEEDNKLRLESKFVSIQDVFFNMKQANNQVNIIILDACRDNPFRKEFQKDRTKGIGRFMHPPPPTGSLIAYATASGQVAKDGNERNSPYTKYLKTFILEPSLSLEKMFKKVRDAVIDETNETQTPWERSSLRGEDIYLAGKSKPEPRTKKYDCEEILKKELRGFDPLTDEEKEFKKTCQYKN